MIKHKEIFIFKKINILKIYNKFGSIKKYFKAY